MSESMYPPASLDLARKRRDLGCPHHAVSLLHPESYQSGAKARSKPKGNHGGDLGRRRDASRWFLRAFGNIAYHTTINEEQQRHES